jgi:hypothetical protein
VEFPDLRRNAFEVLRLVDIDTLVVVIVGYLLHGIGAGDGVSGDEVIEQGRFHQVQGYQLGAFTASALKSSFIRGERQAWEVYLEELGVAGAVGGGVEDGVGVVEDVLRAEGLLKVSPAVFNKCQPQLVRDSLDELRVQVGAAIATSNCISPSAG